MSEPERPTLAESLREAVLPFHRRIEALPFFRALAARTLPGERYLDHLRALAVVHATLEHALEGADDAGLRSVSSSRAPRLRLLLDDLAHFDGKGPLPDDPAPASAALSLARDLTLASGASPARLVGALYVLEGTALGNAVHLEDARAASGGGERGWAFYRGHGAGTAARWAEFRSALDALSLDEASRAEVVAGAVATVASLEKLHALLDPEAPPRRRFLATTLNPEAGEHDVPSDPAELAAALRAGERCLAEFPYFEARWGERGRAYTRSDAGWLAALARMDAARARDQVAWFAGVLARRGMPSLLLERQLRLLVEELAASCPGAPRGGLEEAARELEARRLAAMPGEAAAALAEAFSAAAGHGTAGERLEAARVLLSAVADEATGLAGTLAAVVPWFASGRFPPSWTSAVETLVREGGAAARVPPGGRTV